MKTLFRFTLLFVLIGQYGCMSKSTDTAAQQLRALSGKELLFDQDLFTRAEDSLPTFAAPKIIITVDSTKECTACEMELRNWYIQKEDLCVRGLDLPIVFILQQEQIDFELDSMIHDLGFHCLLDPKGTFVDTNELLVGSKTMHTFLLDRENRVVLVGSPIGNPKMWELYKSTIAKLVENDGTLPTEPENKRRPFLSALGSFAGLAAVLGTLPLEK